MNTKILIVEDEVLIADYIHECLTLENDLTIEIAYTEDEAWEKIQHFNPDIILLDINIEGKDKGIEIALKKTENTKIIFITAQNDKETIEKAITVKPETYLSKPVRKADILAAIRITILKKAMSYIVLKDGYENLKILKDEIVFIKSDKNYIDIQTTTKRYTSRTTLDNFIHLLDDNNFCRVHRSYVINKKMVLKKKGLLLNIGGYNIPISRNINFNLD